MSIRKRNDSVKPGKGIDGTEGEDFSRKYAKDPWGYGEGYGGDERSYAGAYTENESGLRQGEDFSYSAGSRQIWRDVEDNQNPDGEFDTTGPIKAGVNRKQ